MLARALINPAVGGNSCAKICFIDQLNTGGIVPTIWIGKAGNWHTKCGLEPVATSFDLLPLSIGGKASKIGVVKGVSANLNKTTR